MPHHNRERDRYRQQNRQRYENRDWGTGDPNQDLQRGTIFDRSQNRSGNYDINESDYGSHDQYNRDWNRNEWNRKWDQGTNRGNMNRSGMNRNRQNPNYDANFENYDRGYGYGDWDTMDYGYGGFGYFDTDFEDYGTNDMDWYDMDISPGWTYTETWWIVPGPYQGVGPKGYQRTDERICEDICERLTQHGQIDASDIEVDVDKGEVTLKGSVNSRHDKRLAEDIADSVSGVEDIHNQLKVNRHHNQMQSGMPNNRQQDKGRTQTSEMNMGQIRPRMEVVGSNGKRIGKVQEIQAHDILMERTNMPALLVPLSAVSNVSKDQVMLSVPADQIDQQGWEQAKDVPVKGRENFGR